MLIPLRSVYRCKVRTRTQVSETEFETVDIIQEVNVPLGDTPKEGQETSQGIILKVLEPCDNIIK